MSRCPPRAGRWTAATTRCPPTSPSRSARPRRRSPAPCRCTTSSRTAGTLTLAERRLLVEQALVLLEDNYVHLPLKSAMHAVNPVQRLRLLRARLERQTDGDDGPRVDLPRGDVGDLPLGARPAHQLPAARAVRRQDRLPAVPGRAVLDGADEPSTSSPGSPQGMSAPPFGPGVEVTHWNGMPIERAVARERRPLRRQQHGRAARPRPRVADHPPAASSTCRRTRTG